MIWEGSVLDANEGIRFHGHTIQECQKLLPTAQNGKEMLPEAMFWLLLTGQIPSATQVQGLSRTLAEQASLPEYVTNLMNTFPRDMHPMTQFSIAVSALSSTSKFRHQYEQGLNRSDYWEPIFDDCISLLAKLPTIAAKIYHHTYSSSNKDDAPLQADLKKDWAANFASMLGRDGQDDAPFQDFLRLYLSLHGDHEGGNVSAHSTHLVGSALSDPFLSYSAGLQGLAGPLHGLAAQESLRFILKAQKSLGESATKEELEKFLWSTLKAGRVIPGYGHAVLRKPDPRFEALLAFGVDRATIAADSTFRLVKMNSETAPGVLQAHGKVTIPKSNLDSKIWTLTCLIRQRTHIPMWTALQVYCSIIMALGRNCIIRLRSELLGD
jgi:citrate synthase